MPDITPTGPVSLPVYLVRRMLALSPTFQTFTGAANATEALDHIFCRDADGTETRPCAVISSESTQFSLRYGGDQNYLLPRGTVFVWLALDTLEDHYEDNVNAMLRFGNFHGGVGQDVADLSGADQTADATVPQSHLNIREMRDVPPIEIHQDYWDSIGRFWWSGWVIEWGDES